MDCEDFQLLDSIDLGKTIDPTERNQIRTVSISSRVFGDEGEDTPIQLSTLWDTSTNRRLCTHAFVDEQHLIDWIQNEKHPDEPILCPECAQENIGVLIFKTPRETLVKSIVDFAKVVQNDYVEIARLQAQIGIRESSALIIRDVLNDIQNETDKVDSLFDIAKFGHTVVSLRSMRSGTSGTSLSLSQFRSIDDLKKQIESESLSPEILEKLKSTGKRVSNALKAYIKKESASKRGRIEREVNSIGLSGSIMDSFRWISPGRVPETEENRKSAFVYVYFLTGILQVLWQNRRYKAKAMELIEQLREFTLPLDMRN